MARVIVVTSGKGGVGKTTITSNLGMSLARLGHRTLLIDADVGLRNLDLLLGLENRIIYTGLDVVNEKCRFDQAVVNDKRQPNLTFLPLSSNQNNAKITPNQIKSLITIAKASYQFILIDSPAGIDEGFQTSIESATEGIVIVTPEVPSIRDADRVVGLLMAKRFSNIQLVINRVRINMVRTEDMVSIKDVTDILDLPLLGIIPETEQAIISSNRGEPIVLEETSLPAKAFDNLTRRLLGEDLAVIDLNKLPSRNPVRRILRRLIKRPD